MHHDHAMSSPRPDPVLRCPRCEQNGRLQLHAEAAECLSCDATFRSANGIPILVKNDAELVRQIDDARRVNPAWYETEQPPEQASPWRHHLRKRRLYVRGVLKRELARRGVQRVPRLLDLGCGDGNHLGWLGAFAEKVYGSDYNLVRLARARACNANVTLLLGDILDFPVADNAFDIVFFNHVIEHIPDDVAALRTVMRVLAPGGILVLGTPNEGAWWWQLAYRRAPDVRATTDHVHFYTAGTLRDRVQNTGLSIIETEHMGWGPPDWRLDGRIRKYKFVDDAFEWFGRRLMPTQASSLYVIATKGNV
jgi:SAM-dependent methyltransferase